MQYKLFIIMTLFAASCGTKHQNMSQDKTEARIDSIIQLMTLEEKITMIHGASIFKSGEVSRLGIPALVMSDGPHGVRPEQSFAGSPIQPGEDAATYLPTGICLASTWNKKLGYEYGAVLGSEAKFRGKDIILGPGVNIIRSPLNGRNFEYMSEDPYFNSEMAVGYIKGVQDQGISACVKHFAGNNQETNRSKVDVIVSERALREIYLPAFKAAVEKAQVNSVMGAYNLLNGQYCTHNKVLVNDILKGEFGFDGILMSDWGAVMNTKEALLYGTDLEMGTELVQNPRINYDSFFLAKPAMALVESGEVSEDLIDDKVRRILRIMFRTNMFGKRTPGNLNTAIHQQTAFRVAAEGIVLLQNKENFLPLKPNQFKTILVVGYNADYQQSLGGGSSQVKAFYDITALEGITKLAGEGTQVIFEPGFIPTKDMSIDQTLADKAVEAASKADAVIYVGGWIHNVDMTSWDGTAFDMEGQDKKDIKLIYGQEELIQRIAKVNPNTAVVIMGGSNVEMREWMNQVPAILQAWYPGMEGGKALASIIFGHTNPSGKLPMTFANSHTDYSAHAIGQFPGDGKRVEYNDDIYVGYRYFDKKNIEPLFPFGFGLSYTSFKFSDLKINLTPDSVLVSCNVTNSGEIAGAEVVQLYMAPINPKTDRPVQELKGFEKIFLNPGESAPVKMSLCRADFAYYDQANRQWKTDSGDYAIRVGNSSRHLFLNQVVKL